MKRPYRVATNVWGERTRTYATLQAAYRYGVRRCMRLSLLGRVTIWDGDRLVYAYERTRHGVHLVEDEFGVIA